MYPIVEQYIAAVDAANEEYQTQYRETQKAQTERQSTPEWRALPYYERDRAYDKYHATMNALYQTRADAWAAAWTLLGTSDDPMVRFIHEHCAEYPDHAKQILEILPADFPAMRTVARRAGWCEVFDKFAAKAVTAKLIKEDRSPARKKLEKALRDQDIYGTRLQEILELVEADVTTAVRKALVAERKAVRLAKQAKVASKVPTKPKSAIPMTA